MEMIVPLVRLVTEFFQFIIVIDIWGHGMGHIFHDGISTFSGLWHTCNILGVNIPFAVPLRKSSQVNYQHPLSTFATILLFSKPSQKFVNCCNLLETFVNSVHDVAIIKPRKFPAVEIRCKFIGNFRSNQKQLPKC